MTHASFDVPIVFIGFNRPEATARVFEQIRTVRPATLLLIGDGPRSTHPEDAERCQQVREIMSAVDWPCERLTNFSRTNLGCGLRISTGLDWAFRCVDRAIILEDDCLPHPDFFRFCREMLIEYEHDERVGMIGGTNFCFDVPEESYFFTKYIKGWGWASWRRTWAKYDFSLSGLRHAEESGALLAALGRQEAFDYFRGAFRATASGAIDTWDYQLLFSSLIHGWLCLLPTRNLVSNIGMGEGATHTVEPNAFSRLPLEPLSWPLVRNPRVASCRHFDALVESTELLLSPTA